MTVSTSTIIDHITIAIGRVKTYGQSEAVNYFLSMPQEDRLAFDLFLVKMQDPLAYEPGSPQWRFSERVRRMVELSK